MTKTVAPFSMEDKSGYLVLATDLGDEINVKTHATQLDLVKIMISLAKIICGEDTALVHTLCEDIKETVLGDIANAREEREDPT